MLLYNAPKKNSGFTLLELLIVMFMVGLLVAISAPAFIGLSTKTQLNNTVNTVEGALKEAQRESMRKSQYCNVTLNPSSNPPTIQSTPINNTPPNSSIHNCLVTGTRTLDNIFITTSMNDTSLTASPAAFTFNFQGITYTNNANPPKQLQQPITIVFASSNNSSLKKCLVISVPLGLIRTGTYSGSGTSVSGNCSL